MPPYGNSKKHEVALIDCEIVVFREHQIRCARKARVLLRNRRSCQFVRSYRNQLELRVPKRHANQFDAGEARRSHNAAFDAHTIPFPFEV